MTEPKLCVQCKHLVTLVSGEYQCRAPAAIEIDLVTGAKIYPTAGYHRAGKTAQYPWTKDNPPKRCGYIGLHYEAKV